MDRDEVRRRLEQEWPFPERKIDASKPRPWLVTGYSARALRNVMMIDYGARIHANGDFETAEGRLIAFARMDELRGFRGGTVFVLSDPTQRRTKWLLPLLDEASVRGMELVWLDSGPLID